MILNPADLARAGDRCWRPRCQHERKWHDPCTAPVPSDEPGMCGCPRFLNSPDEYEHELAAIAAAEQAAREHRARIAAEVAAAEEQVIGPGDIAPVPPQDGSGGAIEPEVANG